MPAVTVERFPGLNLWADPGDSPGALDAMNVTIEQGRVRSRDGSSLFFTSSIAPIGAYVYDGTGPHLILATLANDVYAITTAGVTVAATTFAGAAAVGMTGIGIGTPSASYFYVAKAGGGTVRRWDGTTWTSPAGFPALTRVLSLSPTDNRLIACEPGSKVNFSDAGAPETFGANNYVYLIPGDGEELQGAAVFNNQTFIFKQTKFFVFFGNSTDGTGEPVFNYRTVDAGIGLQGVAPQSVCAGADGVYFIANTGIYRTTGGPPVKISRAIDPFFTGGASAYWQGGTFTAATIGGRLHWFDGRLYAFLPTGVGGTGIVMVYDSRTDTWTAWDRNAWALTSFQGPAGAVLGTQPESLIIGNNGTAVYKMDPTLAADNGGAIASRYRMPFETYGTPGEKRIRDTILEGKGSPTLRWSADWGPLVTGSAVTLGAAPAIATNRQRLAIRGRAFSFQIGASSGAWALNRAQANIAQDVRGEAIAR